MRPPTVVNQPPINLLLQEDNQDGRLGDICMDIARARFSSAYLERLHRGDVPTNKLDIITDSHILDLHLLAAQHGVTPSDIALQERTKQGSKPLTPSNRLNFCPRCWVARVQGVVISECLDCKGLAKLDKAEAARGAAIEKERAETCAEAKNRSELDHEKKNLACEAEWQRELATWPPLVPRNPIDALQPVVRDLTTLNNTRPVKPFLDGGSLTVIPRTCLFHDRMREFTFKSGETIKMCPDCTSFDKQRVTILKAGKLAEARMRHTKERWEERLKAEGLLAEPPDNPIVLSRKQLKKDLEAIQHAQAAEENTSPAKNNYRASRIRKQVKTHTHAQRNCKRCGKLFVPHHGHTKYCDDCNPKQFHKEKKRSEHHGDSTTQSTINRSTNHEQ